MTVLNEGQHAGEFIVSEANKTRSREAITVLSGENLKAGAILGKVELGAASSAAKAGGNTGDGAMGAVTVGDGAQAGVYTLRIITAAANAGEFQVKDPQGDVVGIGNVGVAFSGGGLSFTLADGATDFVVGDGFDITVAAGSKKYVELDPAATNGSQNAAGVLFGPTDATSADTAAVAIVRDAELNAEEVVWPTGISTDDKNAAIAQLEALGILLR
jgi:hypothetical protein